MPMRRIITLLPTRTSATYDPNLTIGRFIIANPRCC